MSEKVTEFQIKKATVRKGDVVRIEPSAPRARDGFHGVVLWATLIDGDVREVTVHGGRAGHALTRTVRVDRVRTLRATTQDKRRRAAQT